MQHPPVMCYGTTGILLRSWKAVGNPSFRWIGGQPNTARSFPSDSARGYHEIARLLTSQRLSISSSSPIPPYGLGGPKINSRPSPLPPTNLPIRSRSTTPSQPSSIPKPSPSSTPKAPPPPPILTAAEILHEQKWAQGPIRRGMVVECRRSGLNFIGCATLAVFANSRVRWFVLTSTGEMIPSSEEDMQFVFPSSTIPASLAAAVTAGIAGGAKEEGDNARREIARLLRGLEMDLEKRTRLLSTLDNFRAETIYNHFAPLSSSPADDWTQVTTLSATNFILPPSSDPTPTPPSRIDQFITHRLLMSRPEYFQGDEANMRASQSFAVRPRARVEGLEDVQRWLREWGEGRAGKGEEIEVFLEEARAAWNRRTATPVVKPSFSPSSKTILQVLHTRLLETRSTQTEPFDNPSVSMLKALDLFEREVLDGGVIFRFLQGVGEIPAGDSWARVRVEDLEKKDGALLGWPTAKGVGGKGFAARDIPEDQVYQQDPHEAVRHDFGDLPVYVIDAASALELDDGISITPASEDGDYWVHIHVADPTRWLHPGHAASKVAERRGSSLYLPEGNRTLLPSQMVMEKMSLGAKIGTGEGMEVMTFSALVGGGGEIRERMVRAGWVRNVRVVTYEKVDEVLGVKLERGVRVRLGKGVEVGEEEGTGVEVGEGEKEDLRNLAKVAKSLWCSRLKDTGVEYNLPLGSVSLTPSLDETSTGPSDLMYHLPSAGPPSKATKIVAELMITAGRIAGSFCSERGIAAPWLGSHPPLIPINSITTGVTAEEQLRRILDARDPETMELDPVYGMGLGMFVSPYPAGVVPVDHWSMGIKAEEGGYVRGTSPLRRFGDMLAHWQIKAALLPGGEGGKEVFTKEEMARKVVEAEVAAKRIKRVSRSTNQFWLTTFLDAQWRQNPQMTDSVNLNYLVGIPVVVGDAGGPKAGARVYSPELGVVGRMDLGEGLELGRETRVRISKVLTSPNPLVVFERV